MQCLVNMMDESELSGHTVTVFAWSSKKCVVLHHPDGKLSAFYLLILEAFPHVLLSVALTGSSACWNELFGFQEGAHNRGLPSNPTIYTSLSLDEDWPLVWFNTWFGYFEYVTFLPHGITLIVLNKCPDFIAINFNWSTQWYNIVQREKFRMKLCKPLLISHTTFSVHCTNLFVFQLHFYLSWNNKA